MDLTTLTAQFDATTILVSVSSLAVALFGVQVAFKGIGYIKQALGGKGR